jgi:hypothetical protein
MIEHPEQAAALGGAARLRAQSEYGFTRMVGTTEQLYLTEIERHSRTAPLEAAEA